MLHIGMDLSRMRVDGCVVDDRSEVMDRFRVSNDQGALESLPERYGTDVRAVVESMNGARFVFDTLTPLGWDVQIADAVLVKAMAPLTAKTDRIDAQVLADLSVRDLIPSIWIPPLRVRQGRERSRFRVSLVHHRVQLKNRIHATLITFGKHYTMSDLFGVNGREVLESWELPAPWGAHITVNLDLIDHFDRVIADHDKVIARYANDDPATRLLMTAPGIGTVLGYTISNEIGDIGRFATPQKLVSYTGLAPSVYHSANIDRRGPITRRGPKHLRWALIEATTHAQRHLAFRARHQRLKSKRNAKIARVDTARRLATAIWWMLTKREPFAPQGAGPLLTA